MARFFRNNCGVSTGFLCKNNISKTCHSSKKKKYHNTLSLSLHSTCWLAMRRKWTCSHGHPLVEQCQLMAFFWELSARLGFFTGTPVSWQVLASTVPNWKRFIILLGITNLRGRQQCQKSHEQNTIDLIWYF